jgi:hypothetical protein
MHQFTVRRGEDSTHSKYVARVTDYPPVVNLLPEFGPVYDQLSLGACTAFGLTGLASWYTFVTTGVWQEYSELAQYYYERALQGTIDEDSGATVPESITVWETEGVIPESVWPYNVALFTDPPPQVADPFKIDPSYVRYLGHRPTSSDVVSALASGLPVVFGYDVYPGLMPSMTAGQDLNFTGWLMMPGANNNMLLGGHDNVIVGYNLAWQYFLVRNQWSANWARGGYFWMPFDYFDCYAFDAYVVVPPNPLPDLPPLPVPDVSICELPKPPKAPVLTSSSTYAGPVIASVTPQYGTVTCGEPVTVTVEAPGLPSDWRLWLGVLQVPPRIDGAALPNWFTWTPVTGSTVTYTQQTATPPGWNSQAVVRALPANIVPDTSGNPGYIPGTDTAYPEAMLTAFPVFAGGPTLSPPHQPPQVMAIQGYLQQAAGKPGDVVQVIGNGFHSGVKVRFGGRLSPRIQVQSASELSCVIPKGSGVVNITVADMRGWSACGPASKFHYLA